mgnify:CR=1 FL=1
MVGFFLFMVRLGINKNIVALKNPRLTVGLCLINTLKELKYPKLNFRRLNMFSIALVE